MKKETLIQKEESLKDLQFGGNHYKGLKIEPIQYAQLNELNPCEFSVIRYVTRHKQKNGLEDLKKAMHFIQILMEMEYNTKVSIVYDERNNNE